MLKVGVYLPNTIKIFIPQKVVYASQKQMDGRS